MSCNGRCVPVSSRWVRQFILTANCELAVWFKNGVCCLYPHTTQAWFNQAIAAASPGHYVHLALYKKMPYRLIRAPCPPTGGDVSTTCCANSLPATLHATIANLLDTPCAGPTTIALVYDAGTATWTGTAPLGSCGHNITLEVFCQAPAGTTCNNMLLNIIWPNGCAMGFNDLLPTSCACSPLVLVYNVGGYCMRMEAAPAIVCAFAAWE
jgi:hypothetical protein